MIMKFTIKMTEAEIRDTIIFLQRTQLTGAEVPSYRAILEAINKSLEKPTNNK